MQITLNIDLANQNAIALLNYIQTLDFIKIENEKVMLTEAQKTAINEGLKALKNGKSMEHSQVMEETKKRYPNLFKG
ncbi:MAG: hypothetical protein A2275_18185 [Bacteroidetes bacterium RIFOXYA12_FULL_35_11]|nr:MAG: hypothetical protein A2X01_20750 [Bacteroidetes bacterium GWF2_35_48]OFY82691.1 MAG: hypothetical protein A2275_18185 [Bacteroidetes bacterium RIFOXYA12_FULL_35_11]OFY95022.1 MAG: hypothetical protein A2491_16685 [Bacteroidetes bacterium RIFOXYC12_FULL_35_7]OFY95347.1 MAG: hypothetical protein A2309_06450 [Bacteroidetes bacterium RIFOXYB2_FULL_35_7]HBX51793.1 hypothetical protein [Bacteroidales bacterium]